MRSRTLALIALIAAVLLSPVRYVEACGPFFEPEVFVRTTAPDDLASFAAGHLGILQAGYDSNEYAVAYRYLNGGRLTDAERTAYLPLALYPKTASDSENPSPAQEAAEEAEIAQSRQNQTAAADWLKSRSAYAAPLAPSDQSPSLPVDSSGVVSFDESYVNCPGDAFVRATLTLKSRAEAWGKQSPLLADWIRAQDAVFSNCDGKNTAMPAPAPADGPEMLKADRAYQTAAAMFYAHRFDEAIPLFAAIGADKSSPWRPWGQYLAARATVRLAFALGKATDPYSGALASYDAATMQRAQQMLEALLAQPKPEPSRAIIQSELNFVLARTDPEQRAAALSAALAGPGPDSNFGQDLKDLSWMLEKQVAMKSTAPLFQWIATWRGGNGAAAYAAWQQDHALPWHVVAIAKAGPSDSFASKLIDEAAKIEPSSPAYDTVFYHRVRLLIALKRTDEARTLLDAALPALRKQKADSRLNALLGERMAAARDFNEFLQYAPRTLMSYGSSGADDLQGLCNDRAHAVSYTQAKCPELTQSPWLDQDAVQILNQQTPMSLLIEAANSPTLPQNLRQGIALMAWTRSVLLQDAKSAAALAPLLPKAVHEVAGSSTGFAADLAILRNPGMRPYLEQGVPRVASYSEFDAFRDNWWCKHWDSGYELSRQKAAPLPIPSFIPADELAQASSDYQQLQQLPDSAAVIGQGVVDYANQHLNDPLVPEALALTVRATHYACQTWNYDPGGGSPRSTYTPVSKAAFELLHKRYPKSPWTLKTPYYY
jgi:hypothetical protein